MLTVVVLSRCCQDRSPMGSSSPGRRPAALAHPTEARPMGIICTCRMARPATDDPLGSPPPPRRDGARRARGSTTAQPSSAVRGRGADAAGGSIHRRGPHRRRTAHIARCASGAHLLRDWAIAAAGRDGSCRGPLVTDADGAIVTPERIIESVDALIADGEHQIIIYFAGHGLMVNMTETWLLSEAPRRGNAAIALDRVSLPPAGDAPRMWSSSPMRAALRLNRLTRRA